MELEQRHCINHLCKRPFKCLAKSIQQTCSGFCDRQMNGDIFNRRRVGLHFRKHYTNKIIDDTPPELPV